MWTLFNLDYVFWAILNQPYKADGLIFDMHNLWPVNDQHDWNVADKHVAHNLHAVRRLIVF